MPNGQGYTITYDGVASTSLTGFICHRVIRTLVGKNRSELREVSGREGAWIFPEHRGLRKIIIKASVLADTFPVDRREALVAVADWIDKPGMRKLIVSDETDRFYRAMLSSEPDIEEWRELGTFELELQAEPYAYDIDVSTESLSFVPNAVSQTFTMTDTIDAYPVVEVTPVAGSITGWTLVVNGYSLRFEGTLDSGDTTTISSLNYTSIDGPNTDTELTGEFDADSIAMVGVSGDFPVLIAANATQSVRLLADSHTASSVTVDISWRKKFR